MKCFINLTKHFLDERHHLLQKCISEMAKRCCYALSQLILLKWRTQAVAVGMSVSWSVALNGFSLPLRSVGYIFLIWTFQPIFFCFLQCYYVVIWWCNHVKICIKEKNSGKTYFTLKYQKSQKLKNIADGRTNGQIDRWTDGQKAGRTD